MKLIGELLDFIAPRFCVSCKSKLSLDEKFICNNCYSDIKLLSDSDIKTEFKRKFESSKIVEDYTSAFIFEEGGKLQDLIHSLKYENRFKIGLYLGELLSKIRSDKIRNWEADIIIPIPLFHLKKIERGFNQADYIARGLGKSLGIKSNTSFVKRIKNTKTQTKLSLDERGENIRNAFSIKRKEKISGRRIIIIDDVITTGATTLELARQLKSSGAAKVFCLSVATPPFSHSIGSSNAQN